MLLSYLLVLLALRLLLNIVTWKLLDVILCHQKGCSWMAFSAAKRPQLLEFFMYNSCIHVGGVFSVGPKTKER